jgi:hypothetical protein
MKKAIILSIFILTSTCSAQDWGEKIGTFDKEGKLHNKTRKSINWNLGSYGVWYPDSGDVNSGISVNYKRFPMGLDIAPYHIGVGITYELLPVVGSGIGANYTYNTQTNKWEPGLKLQFIKRW